jgi:phosphopantetheine--protein transferase-like protein
VWVLTRVRRSPEARSLNALTDFGIAELISAVPSHNPTFVSRNFTDAEVAYCRAQPSPPSSFAARWAGKEAVFKSLGVKSSGAAASLRDIEVLNDPETGVPFVTLHGEAKTKAQERGVRKVLISLSHSEVSLKFSFGIIAYAESLVTRLLQWHSLKHLRRLKAEFITLRIASLFAHSYYLNLDSFASYHYYYYCTTLYLFLPPCVPPT